MFHVKHVHYATWRIVLRRNLGNQPSAYTQATQIDRDVLVGNRCVYA